MREARHWIVTALVALMAGLAGMGLFAFAAHIKADHDNLHALINIVVQQQQAKNQQQQKTESKGKSTASPPG